MSTTSYFFYQICSHSQQLDLIHKKQKRAFVISKITFFVPFSFCHRSGITPAKFPIKFIAAPATMAVTGTAGSSGKNGREPAPPSSPG
mmetsp:Transcript_2440/g.3938  ORF Transcript_2440/g.3938 Transcript_2440/m.3938 type:complete len:88 (-) Transcript_2440:125-388(-)